MIALMVAGQVEGDSEDSLQQDPGALVAGIVDAIAYSGFREGQHPDRGEGGIYPTDEQIVEDLRILEREGFGLIRLYDSRQNSQDVLRLIQQHGFPIKVMLGIWLSGEVSTHATCAWVLEPVSQEELDANRRKNLEELELGIGLANAYPEIVVAVNVGNEALVTWNDHLVSDEAMYRYLETVSSRIRQPVTTADNYKAFAERGEELAQRIDFAAVHTYPQWEGKPVEAAMAFTRENLLEVRRAMPDTPIAISEAGWASTAIEFGEQASEAAQARHFSELRAFCRENLITLFWFEAFDEPWKGHLNNPDGAEKHWGLFKVDRSPKQAMLER